jgi:hypothetical protein
MPLKAWPELPHNSGRRKCRLHCGTDVGHCCTIGRKRHALVDTDGRGLVIEPQPRFFAWIGSVWACLSME